MWKAELLQEAGWDWSCQFPLAQVLLLSGSCLSRHLQLWGLLHARNLDRRWTLPEVHKVTTEPVSFHELTFHSMKSKLLQNPTLFGAKMMFPVEYSTAVPLLTLCGEL